MANNDIYELTKLLCNKEGLQNDITNLVSVFQKNLQNKYISQIHATADAEQEAVVEHPPREITLLRAMRAFADDNGKEQMDHIIQFMTLMNTVQNINNTVTILSESKEPSIQTMSARNAGSEPSTETPDSEEGNAQLAGLLVTLALAKII